MVIEMYNILYIIIHIILPNRFDLSLNGETYFPSSFMSPVLLSKLSFGIQNLLNIINLSKKKNVLLLQYLFKKTVLTYLVSNTGFSTHNNKDFL